MISTSKVACLAAFLSGLASCAFVSLRRRAARILMLCLTSAQFTAGNSWPRRAQVGHAPASPFGGCRQLQMTMSAQFTEEAACQAQAKWGTADSCKCHLQDHRAAQGQI